MLSLFDHHCRALWSSILLAVTFVAFGQSDTVEVRLVTFYPGPEVFEVYGHSDLRVTQGEADYYFNFGVFDFDSPGFLWRFISGQTDYLCVPLAPKYATIGMEGRRMVEQRLNLSQEQAVKVRDLLLLNADENHREYRYKYFSDNCSTRPRDILETALGDSLNYNAPRDTTITYREMVHHYCRNNAWACLGIDLALGAAIDRPTTYRERMFIPMILMQAASTATVQHGGRQQSLVSSTEVMVDTAPEAMLAPPTAPWASPLVWAVVLMAIAAVLTWHDLKHKQATLWFDCVLFAFMGLAGCLVAYLALCSSHEGTWPNYNLLWLHPLYLVPVVLWCIRRGQAILRYSLWLLAVLLAVTLISWPLLPQKGNPAFFPVMVAMALRIALHLILRIKNKTTNH